MDAFTGVKKGEKKDEDEDALRKAQPTSMGFQVLGLGPYPHGSAFETPSLTVIVLHLSPFIFVCLGPLSSFLVGSFGVTLATHEPEPAFSVSGNCKNRFFDDAPEPDSLI